jgi:hypothetical protein
MPKWLGGIVFSLFFTFIFAPFVGGVLFFLDDMFVFGPRHVFYPNLGWFVFSMFLFFWVWGREFQNGTGSGGVDARP